MISVLGVFCVFASCTAIGAYAASVYKRAAEELDAFYCLVVYIGSQIDGLLMPLDRIYASYNDKRLEENGFLEALRRQGGTAALRETRHKLYMCDEAVAELEEFFEGLGQHSPYDEVRRCVASSERLSELLKAERGALGSKMKLCRAFGALCGILLAVILL